MGLLDSTKLDLLFKNLFYRARTSAAKQYYEENITTALDIHASEIYLNPIPSTPPAATTPVVKVFSSANRLVLTKDLSVANNKAWVALPVWTNNWSSGSNDVTQVMKNFIGTKYGKGYVVKVFKGDGTRIPELDNLNWIFDYKGGVLTFESDPGQNGLTPATSIQIEVYQYIGQLGSQAMTSATLSGLTDVDATGTLTDDTLLGYNTTSQKWEFKKVINQPALYQVVNVLSFKSIFTLNIPYTVGNNSLMVFVNGLLQIPDVNYTETDSNTVTFSGELIAGDVIVFRVESAVLG